MLLLHRIQVDSVPLSLTIYLQDQTDIKGFQERPNPLSTVPVREGDQKAWIVCSSCFYYSLKLSLQRVQYKSGMGNFERVALNIFFYF
jgi:hypothetical protein